MEKGFVFMCGIKVKWIGLGHYEISGPNSVKKNHEEQYCINVKRCI